MSGGGVIEALSRELVTDTARGEPLWFHPRACAVPRPGGSLLVMTAQSISGSDVFGPVHWMTSADEGRTWSDARPVPGFGRRSLPGGMEEGVCDAVPEYHAPTAISSAESIVTVGETLPRFGYQGQTLLARITWRRPNRQAVA